MAPASSLGCPGLPKGVFLPNSGMLSAGMVDVINGVQIGPGATAFTRIPLGPSCCARFAVKLVRAAFVAA
jgi:hypothetical protein